MRVKTSELKTATVGYLYADGHLVLVHEKTDQDAGCVNWVTLYENVGIKPSFENGGRLIIDAGALPFVLMASRVAAGNAGLTHGSENTKSRGIAVQNISLYNGVSDYKGFYISQFPDLISGAFKYQEDVSETFADVKDEFSWSTYRIKAKYPVA